MYTLYYAPGACSLVVHCLLEEFGVPFEARRVNLKDGEHRTPEYRKLNPKGKVPALVTPEGTLTECATLIEHLADRHGDGTLLAKAGTWERAKTLERVATLATEIHPLFNRYFHAPDFGDTDITQEAVKKRGTEKLVEWFREQDATPETPYRPRERTTVAAPPDLVVARRGQWRD